MYVSDTLVLITGPNSWFVQQPHTPSYGNCGGLQDTITLITNVTTLLITSAYRFVHKPISSDTTLTDL